MTTTAETAELIRFYFIQQRTVNLPGIGGFFLNRKPAITDRTTGEVQAPSYVVEYNSLNDIPSKTLFDYISLKADITEWESIGLVNQFATNVKDILKKGQRFHWEGMGSLEIDHNGQLVFISKDIRYDFLRDVHGAKLWNKYGAEYEQPHDQSSAGEDEDVVEERAGWWITVVIVAAVALTLVFFSLVGNDYRLDTSRQTRVEPSIAPTQYENQTAR